MSASRGKLQSASQQAQRSVGTASATSSLRNHKVSVDPPAIFYLFSITVVSIFPRDSFLLPMPIIVCEAGDHQIIDALERNLADFPLGITRSVWKSRSENILGCSTSHHQFLQTVDLQTIDGVEKRLCFGSFNENCNLLCAGLLSFDHSSGSHRRLISCATMSLTLTPIDEI